MASENYSFIGDFQNYTFTAQQLLSDQIVQNQVSLHFMTEIIPDNVTLPRLGRQLVDRTGLNTSQVVSQACLQDAESSFGILLLPELMFQRHSMQYNAVR